MSEKSIDLFFFNDFHVDMFEKKCKLIQLQLIKGFALANHLL